MTQFSVSSGSRVEAKAKKICTDRVKNSPEIPKRNYFGYVGLTTRQETITIVALDSFYCQENR